MNKEIECEIVKDLAMPFVKKSINQETENFIKKHLEICDDCKKYYENINDKENITDKNKDTIMINQFKKINKHISLLKKSLIIILLLIFTIFSIFFIKNQKLVNIINSAYSKIEYMKELDNYKLTVKTIQKNFKTNTNMEYRQNYYYKDGKYKIESNDSIRFYEDDSYENICVYHDLQTIEYTKQNFIEERKGKTINIFSTEILNYKKLSSTMYALTLSVREDRFNGIDCYVIRNGTDNSYRDTWIDKKSFITVRVVNEDYTNFYREEIYSFSENVVTENDISTEILNSDKYQNYLKKDIVNNETEETKLYYDLYDLYD